MQASKHVYTHTHTQLVHVAVELDKKKLMCCGDQLSRVTWENAIMAQRQSTVSFNGIVVIGVVAELRIKRLNHVLQSSLFSSRPISLEPLNSEK